jgi:hypothetical protein
LYVSLHSLPELARLHPLGRILRLARRGDQHRRDLERRLRITVATWGCFAFDRLHPCAGGVGRCEATQRPCDYLAPSIDGLALRRPAHRCGGSSTST